MAAVFSLLRTKLPSMLQVLKAVICFLRRQYYLGKKDTNLKDLCMTSLFYFALFCLLSPSFLIFNPKNALALTIQLSYNLKTHL